MYWKLLYRMVKLEKEAPSFVPITSHKDYGHRQLNGTLHSFTFTYCKICVHPKFSVVRVFRNYLHPFESWRILPCVESTTLRQSGDDLEFPTRQTEIALKQLQQQTNNYMEQKECHTVSHDWLSLVLWVVLLIFWEPLAPTPNAKIQSQIVFQDIDATIFIFV